MEQPVTGKAEAEGAIPEAIRGEAYDWVARLIAGQVGPDDLKALKAWLGQSSVHAQAYREARRVWDALGPVASASMSRRSNEEAVGHPGFPLGLHSSSRRLGRRAFLGGALAASAAYLIVRPPMDLWPSYTELSADYRTGTGEQRQISVAQNVSLDLNTQTSVAIRSQTPQSLQLELISGEAFISTGLTPTHVKVFAGEGSITSDEANFNLRRKDASVSICCLTGALKVGWQNMSETLVAGQQVSYNDVGMGPVVAAGAEAATAWKQGLLIFDATPVSQVVEEVNRYRGGRILLMNDDIGRRQLSARLRITEVDKVVNQIVHIFGAKATTLPGGIVILS